jgi:hypothetical protein
MNSSRAQLLPAEKSLKKVKAQEKRPGKRKKKRRKRAERGTSGRFIATSQPH